MPKFSEQIVDDSGYRRPVEGALVFLTDRDGNETDTDSPNPTWTNNFGVFEFIADDGIYNWSARLGGVEIARGDGVIIGVPPELKGDKGDTGEGVEEIKTPDGAALVGFRQAGSGAVARDLRTQVRELGISPRQFGATEADADQSAAIQLAINACLALAPPAPLRVDGYFRIDNDLIVNRLVDTTTEMFEVVGVGYGAGFHTTAAITMFNTTLVRPSGADYPVSEKLRLRNLALRGDPTATGKVSVMSGLFLRSESIDCDFKWCRFRNDPAGYSQSISLINPQVHNCGDFWITAGAYNINIINPTVGAAAGLFKSLPSPRGVRNWKLFGGVYEANVGRLFVGTGVTGWSAVGVYLENCGTVFEFTPEYPCGGIAYINVHELAMTGPMATYGSVGSRVIFSVVDIGGHHSPANNTDYRHQFVDGNVHDLTVIAGAGHPNYADSTYRVTMNGVTRYGLGETWASNGNQITKSDDGRFGFGGGPQGLTRMSAFAQNNDGSSAIMGGYSGNGTLRFSLMDDGKLYTANAAGALKLLANNTTIASPAANTAELKTAVDAIRAALTASGITL